jgi:hypothetical protein
LERCQSGNRDISTPTEGMIVSDLQPGDGPDPAEIEPTDNSSGAPVDLDRVREVEEQDTTTPNS